MPQRIICLLAGLFLGFILNAQTLKQDSNAMKIYQPMANAEEDLKAALKKAKAEKKHLLIQVGGNWCVWCLRFHKYAEQEKEIKKAIEDNYVVYLLNYSSENKNLPVLARLDFPQRFGFPVFVVLDADGKRLHTQDSGLLELGPGYNKEKVLGFLNNWTPAAIDATRYKQN